MFFMALARADGTPDRWYTCDQAGNSTAFIEFLLNALRTAQQDAASVVSFGTKSALSRHQVEILRLCLTETSITALMSLVGRSDRTKFRTQFLKPLLESGWVEMTLPEKPNTRFQKYLTSPSGRSLLS